MPVSCGIVGLPNVGKSTLFNAITRSSVDASNYPFCTIEPNVGVVAVPDRRLRVLADIFKSKRIVPATTSFVDIAGLVRGASRGEGLGNAFLSHIREVDAVAMVIRCFDDDNVVHVEGRPDPLRDAEIVGLELALADLASVERRLEKTRVKGKSDPESMAVELDALETLKTTLNEGRPARALPRDSAALSLAKELFLLTAKPLLYVANVDEESSPVALERAAELRTRAESEGAGCVALSAKLEVELAAMPDDEAERFARSFGWEERGLDLFIHAAYRLLDLMTFLTAGEKEARAWPSPWGTTALAAAGSIHSDMERGFIRAEIASFADLERLGSVQAVKDAGLMRVEGREYVMQEGDVVLFRFNV